MSITQRNLSGYGLPVIEWERVREALASDHTQAPGTGGPDRHTSWLTSTNPNGTSHVRPLGTGQLEYSAPSAGPPPWWLFRIEPETVYAFGTDETGGATRYEVKSDE